MDLIQKVRHWALATPRVLIIDAPGTELLRWATESELDRRGWSLAHSPADTDLLLVVGDTGPELSEAVDLMWTQVPQPRSRGRVKDSGDVSVQLDAARQALLDAFRHPQPERAAADAQAAEGERRGHQNQAGLASREEPRIHGEPAEHPTPHRPQIAPPLEVGQSGHAGHAGMDHGGGAEHAGHAGMDHGGGAEHAGHAGMGHGGGAEHAGHAGMDHGGGAEHASHAGMGQLHNSDSPGHGGDHQMHHGGVVAGLAMARTAPDRDGLELDVLKVSLGPVLPGWPTGLVLRTGLQGDVLTSVGLSWLDGGDEGGDRSADAQRAALDHLSRFLLVAGLPATAREARRARDGLVSPDASDRTVAQRRAERVARRVRRSRSLAWSVRGAGLLPAANGITREEIMDRVLLWCDAAVGGETGERRATTLDDLEVALRGAELGTARLIVASVELDPVTTTERSEVTHG